MGEMAEMYDPYFEPEDDDDDDDEPLTCRRCGKPFEWTSNGVRWRMRNPDGTLHNCATAASPDEFQDLTQEN